MLSVSTPSLWVLLDEVHMVPAQTFRKVNLHVSGPQCLPSCHCSSPGVCAWKARGNEGFASQHGHAHCWLGCAWCLVGQVLSFGQACARMRKLVCAWSTREATGLLMRLPDAPLQQCWCRRLGCILGCCLACGLCSWCVLHHRLGPVSPDRVSPDLHCCASW